MSTQSLTNEIGGERRERRERGEGRKEGRLTVPCNEERGSSGGQKKDFGAKTPKRSVERREQDRNFVKVGR